MSKKDRWEPCPRCESNRVQPARTGCMLLIGGICLIGLGLWLLIIPFVGIPMVIVGIGFILFSLFAGPATKGMLQCQDCHNAWKPSEDKGKCLPN